MNFFLPALLIFLASAQLASACRAIPEGADGKQVQTVAGITGRPEYRQSTEPKAFGDDVVYQGGQCPTGKICIETIFSAYGSLTTPHGQVVILDAQTGAVEQLVPLRTKDLDRDLNKPLSERGFGTQDPKRMQRFCDALISENESTNQYDLANLHAFCGRPYKFDGGRGVTYTPPYQPTLDIYYYPSRRGQPVRPAPADPSAPANQASASIESYYAYITHPREERRIDRYEPVTNSPVSGDMYNAFSSSAKARLIQALNTGNLSDSAVWSTANNLVQTPSIQPGGAGTGSRLARLIGSVRSALGCEPTPQDPTVRLTQAAFDSRQGLEACGLTLKGAYASGIISCSDPQRCLTTKGVPLTYDIATDAHENRSSGRKCKSKIKGLREVITCNSGDGNNRFSSKFDIYDGRIDTITFEEHRSNTKYTCNLNDFNTNNRRRNERSSGATQR